MTTAGSPRPSHSALRSFTVPLLLLLWSCGQSGPTWEQELTAGKQASERHQYAEAERFFTAAAQKAEQFGHDDPRIAVSLTHLAGLYHSQGRYVDAEPLYGRALAIYEHAYGSEHADVAATLRDLGVLHQMQGRFAEAEPLLHRALKISEGLHGPDHPDVGVTLSDLARLYYTQGRYTEAEPLYQRVLSIREQVLGPEHPDVATSLKEYALLLLKTNRGMEASKLVARAKAISAKQVRQDVSRRESVPDPQSLLEPKDEE